LSRRTLLTLSCGLAVTLAVLTVPTAGAATKVATPSKFTKVSAVAGPRAGEITIKWKQNGKNTTRYELETALSLFSKNSTSSLPRVGRHQRVFRIKPKQRSLTLTADQVREAGAGVGSGVHLLYRFSAINHTKAGDKVRRYPTLQAIQPEAHAAGVTSPGDDVAGSTALRMATFNVRTANATADVRPWMARRDDVAELIYARHPDVVALQELGPGRADGKNATTTGILRQTTSLLESLAKIDADNYKLVRTTPYVKAGSTHGSQGPRILYDSNKLTLVSDCPEATGKDQYSPSCSVELPLLDGDSESNRRSAAYAKFADKKTKQQFYVASVHLDARHDTSKAKEAVYNKLRGAQVSTVLKAIDKINTNNLPVTFGGDLNSWQNITVGDAPHETMINEGFTDSASSAARVNDEYSTFNGFAVTQRISGMRFGSRLDGLFVRGGTVRTYENVTKVKDTARPSDHNMVIATLVLEK
jgi:endonuclease/exonuclease/phosphatase family metal-dependent hydrolase